MKMITSVLSVIQLIQPDPVISRLQHTCVVSKAAEASKQQSQSVSFVLEELAALFIHLWKASKQLQHASAGQEGDS